VLHGCVRSREDECLVTVGVADQIWRCAISSPDLEDLRCLVRGTDNPSVNVQAVSHCCAHAYPSPRALVISMYLSARVRKSKMDFLTET
jgi:hypothetical protein